MSVIRFCSLLVLATGIAACDSTDESPVSTHFSNEHIETARSLRDQALAGSYSYEVLVDLLATAPKRLAGYPDDVVARDWAVDRLEALNFDRVWVQEFQMHGWKRVSASVTVDGREDLALNVTSLGKSVSTPAGGVTAEIVHFATLADLVSADAADVAGKLVFISNRMVRQKDGSGYGPAVVARARGHAETAAKGGVGLLIRSIGTGDHDEPHTGSMNFAAGNVFGADQDALMVEAWNAPYGEQTVAAVALSNPDADALQAIVESGNPVTATLDVRNEDLGEITSYNIIGEITGSSRPDEIVITGGHIDAWDTGVGAMDDGMGVAVTMNAVRLISELPERPARTLRYVAFGAEELGLIGAFAYASEYGSEDHVFGTESDFGLGKVWRLTQSVSDDSVDVMADIWTHVLEPMGIGWDANIPGFPGPDLLPMAQRGMAGASLNGDGTRYFDLHHSGEDTLDKIDAADLDFNTAAYTALLYLVAEYDGRFDNRSGQ